MPKKKAQKGRHGHGRGRAPGIKKDENKLHDSKTSDVETLAAKSTTGKEDSSSQTKIPKMDDCEIMQGTSRQNDLRSTPKDSCELSELSQKDFKLQGHQTKNHICSKTSESSEYSGIDDQRSGCSDCLKERISIYIEAVESKRDKGRVTNTEHLDKKGTQLFLKPDVGSTILPASKHAEKLQNSHSNCLLSHASDHFVSSSTGSNYSNSVNSFYQSKPVKAGSVATSESPNTRKKRVTFSSELENMENDVEDSNVNPTTNSKDKGKGKEKATDVPSSDHNTRDYSANIENFENDRSSQLPNDGSYNTLAFSDTNLSVRHHIANYDPDNDEDISNFLRATKSVNSSSSSGRVENSYKRLPSTQTSLQANSDEAASEYTLKTALTTIEPPKKERKQKNKSFLMSGGVRESPDALVNRINDLDTLGGNSSESQTTTESQIGLISGELAPRDQIYLYHYPSQPHLRRTQRSRDGFDPIRLPQDARVRRGYLNSETIRIQHNVGIFCLIFGVMTYPFGGFLLINSLKLDGECARSAMVSISPILYDCVVNVVHPRERRIASIIEKIGIGFVGLLMAFCVGVCSWALATGLD